MSKFEVTREQLFEMYVTKEMSTRDIAAKLGCGQTTVRRKLESFGIPTRSDQEARKTNRYLAKAKLNKPPVSKQKVERVSLVCPTCGKTFERIKTLVKHVNYCSKECADKAKIGKSNETVKNGKYVNCSNCGKEIYRSACRLKKTSIYFCSNACQYEWRKKTGASKGNNSPTWKGGKEKLICPVCGKSFERIRAEASYHDINYCSRECMAKDYSKRFSGKNSPTWQGGDIDYYGPNWHEQRRKARERDNYTCQLCGITEQELGKELSVHHIKKFRDCKDYIEANQLDNLVSLCEEKCHRYVHSNQYKGELENFGKDNDIV